MHFAFLTICARCPYRSGLVNVLTGREREKSARVEVWVVGGFGGHSLRTLEILAGSIFYFFTTRKIDMTKKCLKILSSCNEWSFSKSLQLSLCNPHFKAFCFITEPRSALAPLKPIIIDIWFRNARWIWGRFI